MSSVVGAHPPSRGSLCGESLDFLGEGLDWPWPSDGRGQNGILGIRKTQGWSVTQLGIPTGIPSPENGWLEFLLMQPLIRGACIFFVT